MKTYCFIFLFITTFFNKDVSRILPKSASGFFKISREEFQACGKIFFKISREEFQDLPNKCWNIRICAIIWQNLFHFTVDVMRVCFLM